MGTRITGSGLVIAGLGFFLTRFTVTLSVYETPTSFYLAGVVPLVLGLGLAAFGVALAVSDIEQSLVRTVAFWCVLGTGTMLVLVVLTLVGSSTGTMPDVETVRTRAYLSNFLIGGSIGGTLTGLYAGHNRRQRETLRQQTNRLEVLNRILRHQVLNSVSVIKGYAGSPSTSTQEAQPIIEKNADSVVEAIERVKYLTRTAGLSETQVGTIDVKDHLTASIQAVQERYPDATISVGPLPDDLAVRANGQVEQVFTHLLENAIVHTDDDAPSVEVSVTTTDTSVRIGIADEGPGLPDDQRALLETGEIDEFDNPNIGFGLNIVRLLVESFRGTIDTDVRRDGTMITVALPRSRTEETGFRPNSASLLGVRPTASHLVLTLGAAILAGVLYGIAAEVFGGSVGFIGVYYGMQHPVIGWLTHEFHSVVFGFMFAGLVSLAPASYRNNLHAYVAIGAAWGVVLWFVAAGFISPIWLRLVGIQTSIPTLSGTILVAHLIWGVSLGALTALGYRYLSP